MPEWLFSPITAALAAARHPSTAEKVQPITAIDKMVAIAKFDAHNKHRNVRENSFFEDFIEADRTTIIQLTQIKISDDGASTLKA
jgi:hypothetical protein